MRSVCVALTLLLVYLILVFLAFRFLDIILWYQHGVPSTQIVNPLLLSVRQLKQLLEVRGVSYTGYVEKKELAQLVEDSADVVQGEVEELIESNLREKDRLSFAPSASHFTGSAHFYEEVEDTKDSVWLVQVVPTSKREPLLDDYTWTIVRNQVAPFAIRTGIFDCRVDSGLCKRKGWTKSLLLLAMPRGTKPKDKVIMRTCQLTRSSAIIEWLREQLSVRVKKVSSYDDLEKDWLHTSSNSTSNDKNISVKVLLLTHLLHPPLFLAALSIKFTGRITFGMFTVKKEETSKIGKVPAYLVITPDKTMVYGRRRMEHYNLKSMNAYLKSIQPEMNDFFLCSLLLVNMFAVLQFLQVCSDSWLRLIVASLWTIVVCNLLLFSGWLIAFRVLRWPIISSLCEWCLSAVRAIALSETGSLVRSDWLRLLRSTWLFVCSLFAFGFYACRKLSPGESSGTSWWDIYCLIRYQQPPLIEHEARDLIERLAVPSFWLQPMHHYDYIRDLPVWTFQLEKKVIKRDTPEAIETIMDSNDDNIINELTQRDLTFENQLTLECAICLDNYTPGVNIVSLPCSHNYHQNCISTWLYSGKHDCPICRWPAYRSKKLN